PDSASRRDPSRGPAGDRPGRARRRLRLSALGGPRVEPRGAGAAAPERPRGDPPRRARSRGDRLTLAVEARLICHIERGAAPLLHAAKPLGASTLSYERGTAPLLHAAKPLGASTL